MRKIVKVCILFLCTINIQANELLKYIEDDSKDGLIQKADLLAKEITVMDAVATNFTIQVLNEYTNALSGVNKANSMIHATKTLNSDFYEMFYKSMYEAPSKKSMRSILGVISENDEGFKLIEEGILNNSLTIKKVNTFKENLTKSSEVLGKGLSAAGFLFSIYGLSKDGYEIYDKGFTYVRTGKFVLGGIGVLDAGIGLSVAYKLPWAKTGFVKALSSTAFQSFNLGLGAFQISSAIVQADRDKTVAQHFISLVSQYNIVNTNAQNDIEKINQYLFNNNQKKLSFLGIFNNSTLKVFSIYDKKNEFKNEYSSLTNNQEFLKNNFKKDNFSELDQYEKLFTIQFALQIIYRNIEVSIRKEMQEVINQGKITFDLNGVRNIYIGFLSAGSGWDVYNDANKMLTEIIENEKFDILANMRGYYAMDFTHKAKIYLYEKGKLMEEAKRQLGQKLYDDEYALNNSYKKKISLGVAGDMVSFNYDASNRIDKCISSYDFYIGLNYMIDKKFGYLGGHKSYLNNKELENFSELDKKTTIKEALYFIDLYSNELLSNLNFDKRYKLYLLSPKGKPILRNIYKQTWNTSFNKLGLDKYVKRQYIQMQGGTIGLTKNDMSNLNQCLIGYKAVDLLDKYEKTLYYYYNLSKEGN